MNTRLDVLPPDINESRQDFSVHQDRIRFGLAAVKNVGESALDSIVEEREKNGRYLSLIDFCNRIDSRRVNNRVIESLIKSGSFDSLGAKRSQLMAVLPESNGTGKGSHSAIGKADSCRCSRLRRKTAVRPSMTFNIPDIEEWEEREKLLHEKETVGFYITGHPLENALAEIKTITDATIANLGSLNEGQPVRVGGLIRECKQHKSKRGEPMAFVTLEDVVDTVEVMVFPETYATCYRLLSTPDPVIVSGTIQKNERGAKLIAEEIHLIPEALQKYTQSIHATLEADSVNRPRLEELKQLLFNYHGKCPFSLTLHFSERRRGGR